MLARGLTYAQVASELHPSINTVRTHVRSAYEKLQSASPAVAGSHVHAMETVPPVG